MDKQLKFKEQQLLRVKEANKSKDSEIKQLRLSRERHCHHTVDTVDIMCSQNISLAWQLIAFSGGSEVSLGR